MSPSDALTFALLDFSTGVGFGIAIGWWIGDLVRWACRWYWERRS